jgi:hypothetical protein
MAGPAVAEAVRFYGGLIVNRLVDGLQQSEQSASGNLEESIGFTISNNGANRLTLDIELADYYKFVDEGRKAGKWPPRSKILTWLTMPNVLDRLGVRGQLPIKEHESLAYLISRKIAREGTKGNHFFTNVVEKSGIIDEMAEAIGTAAVDDFSAMIDALNSKLAAKRT